MLQQQVRHQPEVHHTPVVTSKISQIPEEESSPTPPPRRKKEESSPTPPARRKRDKPIKITKRNSKSSGELTPSDSPKKDSSSSTDSSPLVNKATRQEVTSSSENSPLVNKVIKHEVISSDDTPVTNNDDTINNDTSYTSDLVTKQMVTPTPSGNGPVINVSSSFADEIIKQFDTKATTSDYFSSTDLQPTSEDTGPMVATVIPTKGEDTTDTSSSVIAKMKTRGHSRTHSAPLVLDEEPKTESETIAVTTVDIMTSSNEQNKSNKGNDRETKEDKNAPPIVVHYLGPLVLRKEVESLLIREGLSYLEHKDFPILSPTVYWNLVSISSDISAIAIGNSSSAGVVLH